MNLLTGIQLELNLGNVVTVKETKVDELRIENLPPEKLPTLLQFLKTQGKKKLAGMYPVVKVWKPGKFPNYSLETEKFRVSISENNPAYLPFKDFLDAAVESGSGFALVVDDKRDGAFTVRALSDDWDIEDLGQRGYRFTSVTRG